MKPNTYVIVAKDKDGYTVGYLGPFAEYNAAHFFACELYKKREISNHAFRGSFRVDTVVNPANLEEEEN